MRIAKSLFLVGLAFTGFAFAADASAMSPKSAGQDWPDWIGTIEDMPVVTAVPMSSFEEGVSATTRAGSIPEYYRPLHYRQLIEPTQRSYEYDRSSMKGPVDRISPDWPLWIDRPDWIR